MIRDVNSGRILAERLEWMKTAAERTKGMLKFTEAPENYAAIFHLPFSGFLPMVHTYGMKFSIDIVFCDKNKKVLHLYLNTPKNKFIFPAENILGGCEYLLEFSNCDLLCLEVGSQLSWEAA